MPHLSLMAKSRFPAIETGAYRDRFEVGLVDGKAEQFALSGLFGWQVDETNDTHAVWEVSFVGVASCLVLVFRRTVIAP